MTAETYFAAVLALASLLASEIVADARPPVRALVRVACACHASLACAMLAASLHLADAMLPREIVLIAFALAPVALVLALVAAWERTPPTHLTVVVLCGASITGITAALGAPFVAFGALFASACAMLALAARHFGERPRAAVTAVAAALSSLAGAAACLADGNDANIALSSFMAAGLVGLSLACALEPVRAAQG
jgi:hypothetical protein